MGENMAGAASAGAGNVHIVGRSRFGLGPAHGNVANRRSAGPGDSQAEPLLPGAGIVVGESCFDQGPVSLSAGAASRLRPGAGNVVGR
jgi:hypothetical protein